MKRIKNKNFDMELIPLPRNAYTPFPVTSRFYKIYKDGNHFVGTIDNPHRTRRYNTSGCLTQEQRLFDELYVDAMKQGIKQHKLFSHLKSMMLDNMPELKDIDNFITENIKRKKHNFYSRLKRLRRKAQLNLWNKWVAFTYDDKKMDEETFRKKLRKCLSNLSSRRGWRVMGVFEKGEIGERLHFHAIMYVPEDKMIGEIVEKRDYSTKQHKMQITHSNTFFAKTFGRNDFEELNPKELDKSISYLVKYMEKSGEKFVYSRGIPTEIYKEIDDDDVATEYLDFCTKFVFFDDVIDTEIDVMHFKYQQANLFDDYYSSKYMTG